jgi:hypothetical protein
MNSGIQLVCLLVTSAITRERNNLHYYLFHASVTILNRDVPGRIYGGATGTVALGPQKTEIEITDFTETYSCLKITNNYFVIVVIIRNDNKRNVIT